MKKLYLYKSCNTLPIARFFRIFETDDLRNLIKKFDYENDEIKLTENQQIKYKEIFEDIYYEYSDITENHKLRSILKKQILIEEWSFLYTLISSLINLYVEYKSIDTLSLINELDEKKYQINIDKPIEPQIKNLVMKMKGLKNKIKIFKLKLARSIKTNKEQTKIDLNRDALYLERNLELKRSIDPEVDSVSTWVRMIQMNKQKVKENGNRNSIRNKKS